MYTLSIPSKLNLDEAGSNREIGSILYDYHFHPYVPILQYILLLMKKHD
jgi:hypothetical protein